VKHPYLVALLHPGASARVRSGKGRAPFSAGGVTD
jgi:hypothetical protein